MNNKVIIGIIAVVVVIGGIVLLQQSDTGNKVLAGNFSTDITGLAEAKASETIELKNGDTYNLSASIVKKTIGNNVVKMLAYNGMIPGPMIKVDQGAEVTLNFTNNTDVDTTIHSHGVRLENKFDGVPDVTQKEVKPGESFTYRIKFPDEGMYWYHPHIREDYAQELGLYGNYLVTPNDPNYWSPVNREVALFVDDILIENGKIATFSKASADRTLMGRFGNTMLVNGETNYALATKAGEVIRFYITNSANTRVFNLSIPGAKIKLVGADGGKYERETWIDGVVLGPSERAVVEVLFANAGSYKLEHKTPDRTYTLGTIIVSNEKVAASFEKEFAVLRSNKDIQSEIDAFRLI
ncbi:MAG: Multicopper oxidase family protein [Parcubacteria group bacterium GW2011_GWC2_40_10]|nr:MAG: Multicopper oxidase family protein [Parcubacteria group bacterium GW2011_GWC2_40_10]